MLKRTHLKNIYSHSGIKVKAKLNNTIQSDPKVSSPLLFLFKDFLWRDHFLLKGKLPTFHLETAAWTLT